MQINTMHVFHSFSDMGHRECNLSSPGHPA